MYVATLSSRARPSERSTIPLMYSMYNRVQSRLPCLRARVSDKRPSVKPGYLTSCFLMSRIAAILITQGAGRNDVSWSSEFRTSVLPSAGLVFRSDREWPDGLHDLVVEYNPRCPSCGLLYFGYPAHSKPKVPTCRATISYDSRRRAIQSDMIMD